MKKMMKMVLLITIPCILMMGLIYYFFFGTGVMSGYRSLTWEGIDTRVPAGFSARNYVRKQWRVYSLNKLFLWAKIAVAPAMNVLDLPRQARNVKFQHSAGSDRVYYITSAGKKGVEVVFAQTIDDTTLYFSVAAASALTARKILRRVAGQSLYNGRRVGFSEPAVPLGVYTIDLLYWGGSLLVVPLIIFLFYFGGKPAAEKHFQGDPVTCDESFIYFRSKIKRRRRGSWGYLALTPTRLILFLFGKPIFEIEVKGEDAEITFDGKKMIIVKGKDRVSLKPDDLDKWKTSLSRFA
ncbi:MAG: hypothetical protein GY940_02120 [bacterium]|nr:hypothetical protein [bacterium]